MQFEFFVCNAKGTALANLGIKLGVVLAIGMGSVQTFAQSVRLTCGSLQNHYGPYDYRTDKNKLAIVEGAHFTPPVEALIRGSTTSTGPAGDIVYTLQTFPNHHRALLAIMRFGEKVKSAHPTGLPLPIECYFERALRFRPDDLVARMIYTTFLSKNNRNPEAMQQLELVTAAAQDNAFTYYNIGLIYFDMKSYDKSLTNAHKAYALGFGSPELRDQLKSAGKWVEPEVETPKPEKPVGVEEKR